MMLVQSYYESTELMSHHLTRSMREKKKKLAVLELFSSANLKYER